MAKKTKKTSDTVTLTSKDKKTLGSIRDLADGVVQSDGPIEGVLSDYRAA